MLSLEFIVIATPIFRKDVDTGAITGIHGNSNSHTCNFEEESGIEEKQSHSKFSDLPVHHLEICILGAGPMIVIHGC